MVSWEQTLIKVAHQTSESASNESPFESREYSLNFSGKLRLFVKKGWAPASESSRTGSRDLFPRLLYLSGIHAGGGGRAWTHRRHLVAVCGTTGRDTGSGSHNKPLGGHRGKGHGQSRPPEGYSRGGRASDCETPEGKEALDSRACFCYSTCLL